MAIRPMSEEKKKNLNAYVAAYRAWTAAFMEGDRQAQASAMRTMQELALKALTHYRTRQSSSATPPAGARIDVVHGCDSASTIFARRRAQAGTEISPGPADGRQIGTARAAGAAQASSHDAQVFLPGASIFERRRAEAQRAQEAEETIADEENVHDSADEVSARRRSEAQRAAAVNESFDG